MAKKNNCKAECIKAGMALADNAELVWFPVNVAGLVKSADLKVPHSELAMHSGAAGRKILAWSIKKKITHIIFKNKKGCCTYAHGLPSELLSHELRRLFKNGRLK